jgi:hypothetical protein
VAGGLPDQYRLLSTASTLPRGYNSATKQRRHNFTVRETIAVPPFSQSPYKAPVIFMTEETTVTGLRALESAWHCKSIVEDIEQTHHLLYAR